MAATELVFGPMVQMMDERLKFLLGLNSVLRLLSHCTLVVAERCSIAVAILDGSRASERGGRNGWYETWLKLSAGLSAGEDEGGGGGSGEKNVWWGKLVAGKERGN